jgi:deoxyribonuclease V
MKRCWAPAGLSCAWRLPHYTMLRMKNKPTPLPDRAHSWKVPPARARAIQHELRSRWEGTDHFREIRTIAGLDASFILTGPQSLKISTDPRLLLRRANRAIGCAVVYRYPEMQEIARAVAVLPLEFPYIPGLLSFREIPVLLAALKNLDALPDLLFCDGQGYAHPRRMGLATHLGILLDCPTIGCAKSLLIGSHGPLAKEAGSCAPLVDAQANGECIGAALRTRASVRPMYVSPGHRISLASAIQWTLRVTDGLRIPRPTRDADRLAGETKKKLLAAHACEK